MSTERQRITYSEEFFLVQHKTYLEEVCKSNRLPARDPQSDSSSSETYALFSARGHEPDRMPDMTLDTIKPTASLPAVVTSSVRLLGRLGCLLLLLPLEEWLQDDLDEALVDSLVLVLA